MISIPYGLAGAVILPALTAYAQGPVAESISQATTSLASKKEDLVPSKFDAPEIIVSGKRPVYAHGIDRRSYNIGSDLQTGNGSIADVLRNIPSVSVSPGGELSLRGDSNVTILVDGQPSSLLSGGARATAIQQLSAREFERIEVITNPSAAFEAEGTAGIINLISRKNFSPGVEGSLGSEVNSLGSWKISASGSGHIDASTISIDFSSSRKNLDNNQKTDRLIKDVEGNATVSDNSESKLLIDAQNAKINFNNAYASNLKSNAALDLYNSNGFTKNSEKYISSANVGDLVDGFSMVGKERSHTAAVDSTFGVDYSINPKGDKITFRSAYDGLWFASERDSDYTYALPLDNISIDHYSRSIQNSSVDFKLEYYRSSTKNFILTSGFEIKGQNNIYNKNDINSAGTPIEEGSSLSDRFRFYQNIYAGYTTLEWTSGALTVLPGLRLEDADLRTSGMAEEKTQNNYLDLFPTLHLNYQLDEKNIFSFSFSKRTQRPLGNQLDAREIYISPQQYQQGNPFLSPAITNSIEAEYEYQTKAMHISGTAYYRNTSKEIYSISEALPGSAVLTTWANGGNVINSGFEGIFGLNIGTKLVLNLNTEIFWNQLSNEPSQNLIGKAGVSDTIEARADWTPDKNNFFQFSFDSIGRQLNAQGFTASIHYLDIGYRRTLSDKVSFEVKMVDAFDSLSTSSVISTPSLQQKSINNPKLRSLSLGFIYKFGQSKEKSQKDFDFSTSTQ